MTINEFRAWLDGFKEAMGDAPTPEQWAKVLAKIEALEAIRFPPVPLSDATATGPYATSGGYVPLTSSSRPSVTSWQIGGAGIDQFPIVQSRN